MHAYIHTYIHTYELADQLAKEAITSREAEIIYSKIPKSVVIRTKRRRCRSVQSEWDASTKGAITKSFFPTMGD